MSTQIPSGKARHPASVAVAPLISPSRVKVSAEKPGGGAPARTPSPPERAAHPAAASASRSNGSNGADAALAKGGPGRGTGMADPVREEKSDVGTRRPP